MLMIITNRDHAVALGAGMAGLLAARAVAGAYECVTIVDRDEMPRILWRVLRHGPATGMPATAADRDSGPIGVCAMTPVKLVVAALVVPALALIALAALAAVTVSCQSA
jgi:hypothetical protein